MLDSLLAGFLKVHQALYEATDGRIGHRTIGVPSLLLRTTGRKTGQPRCAALVYAKDGAGYVVVASKGGADVAPGWFFNAEANPNVEIQVGRRSVRATAKPVNKGDADYDRLWRLVNDKNRGRYDGYQAKTARPIPLLVLTPAA
jgi:deazaflavin-dependent oxidoreductase (nitroreductase family)